MSTSKKTYSIGRKTAAELLKVSVRTIDRYVKAKKLSSVSRDGRIRLNREEVVSMSKQGSGQVKVDNVDMSTPVVSIDKVDNVDTESVYSPIKIYENLFKNIKQELAEKQERLEIANYRVGQLENQIRNSIPILQYHKEEIKKLFKKLKNEEHTKKIFFITIIIILLLQPLWLFLVKN